MIEVEQLKDMRFITTVLVLFSQLLLTLANSSTRLPTVISINECTDINPKCCNRSNIVVCNSSMLAFKYAQRMHSDVTIVVNTTFIQLNGGVELHNMNNLTICPNYTFLLASVHCSRGAGISIFNSNNVIIRNLLLRNCGSIARVSTQYNWPATILLEFVSNIFLQKIKIIESTGAGLVLINPHQNISIDTCLISGSDVKITSDSYPGGGGLLVLHNVIHPFFATNLQSYMVIRRCIIVANIVHGVGNAKGGATAIILKGQASHNYIAFEDVYMSGNQAVLGGGIYALFADMANNNLVWSNMSNIFGHKCFQVEGLLKEKYKCIGGAANVQFRLDPNSEKAIHNRFVMDGAAISKNIAYAGGGISVSATKQSTKIAETNTFLLKHSRLTFNRAQIGSSLHFSAISGQNGKYSFIPTINTVVIMGSFVTNKNNVTVGNGALYTNDITVFFEGVVNFQNCIGTPIVASGAELVVMNQTVIKFTHNTGKLGGAMALVNQASLQVMGNSQLLFINNSANEKGGAIYLSNYYDNYAFPLAEQQCAINFTFSDNKPRFYFSNNLANQAKNSIFATSVLSCPTMNTPTENIPPFCWTNWEYNNSSCESEVFTSPATIQYTNNKSIEVVPGFPFALPISLIDDYGKDITNRSVLSASIIKGNAVVDSTFQYIIGGEMIIYGVPNTASKLAIQTSEPRVVYTELPVHFQNCPPGYYPQNRNSKVGTTCICGEGFKPTNVILCNKDTFSARILNGYCMTYDHELNTTIEGSWRFFSQINHHTIDGYNKLPQTTEGLDKFFCMPFNRTGRLCGECQQGTGVPVYSYNFQCVSCSENDVAKYIFLYILAELVPVTLFFVLIILFNISITTGPANAFVFYSQLVTLPYAISHIEDQINWLFKSETQRSVIFNAFGLPYSIWNLDFFHTLVPPFCLSPKLTTMHVTALNFISALYSFLLIIFFYTFIELYASNCRPVTFICRPLSYVLSRFRRNWRIRTSFIDAFTTFLVLSYTKLCSVSFLLLVPNSVYTATGEVKHLRLLYVDSSVKYGSEKHQWYIALAVSVLCLIVIPLPLILLLYPLNVVQKCLNFTRMRRQALVAFMDSFQGCYKDGSSGTRDMRWFSAIYFFARILNLTITMTATDTETEYLVKIIVSIIIIIALVVCQPYKKRWHTILDVVIFNIIVILCSCCLIPFFHSLNKTVIYSFLCLLYFPLLYVVFYVSYHIICSFFNCGRMTRKLRGSSYNSFSDSIPDRLLHPEEYEYKIPAIAEDVNHESGNEDLPLLH